MNKLPDIVVLPGLWTGGYTPASPDSLHERCMDSVAMICSLCEELGIYAVAGSIPWRTELGVVNRAWIVNDIGERFAFYDKTHLSSAEKKDKLFISGDYPSFFNIGGVTCSVIIGHDVFYPEFTRCLSLGGAKVIFVLSCGDSYADMEVMLRAAALSSQVFMVVCVPSVRRQGFYCSGGSFIISPLGEVVLRACPEDAALSACIDLFELDKCRQNELFLKNRRPDLYTLLSD